MSYFDKPRKSGNLRVIRTGRTEEEINSAARNGFRPLIKLVNQSKDIHFQVAIYQNRHTGEIKLAHDCRGRPIGEEFELIKDFFTYYPYNFPEPYAAYLIPKDIKEGERVWVEDIIEDILSVHGNQNYHPRLKEGDAVWEKGDIRILFDPKKDSEMWIG